MGKVVYEDDNKLLAALARAMVERPKANLHELAKAVGISKATLYRFCKTRELLIERLLQSANHAISKAIHDAGLDDESPLEALRRLSNGVINNQEFMMFLLYNWDPDRPMGIESPTDWYSALDGFFLRGQQLGVFRIDIAAAAMSEFWFSILIGLQDAERRGRVARMGLSTLVESVFLQGVARV
ncbi:TetR/AcrR family transcriptional regulator [Serratia marcescens]|uniref:Transcriptional regulator n=1 Tax=Serratia marcescens TaxID=615 RepID=A0A379YZ31_SERMA|nr:TetR/AcrR family transcriptional regulator [Serratia marcescens]ELA7784345.1 TetR/AcrR family transcriptional regulator [Serratia marcescens]KFD14545.1 homeodomain protein [Serratia marcescens subsp. marcescens ATCC 13880]KFL03552.1 helix-turn-helix domain, rpiR family protein [Serratia marcescens]MBN5344503.1 TetR/AcrR family transcriptional regulator [Serratia marcescens]MCC3250198.1 TetR/AcrR family transcriptional regulator [Serratia marcescens]